MRSALNGTNSRYKRVAVVKMFHIRAELRLNVVLSFYMKPSLLHSASRDGNLVHALLKLVLSVYAIFNYFG